MYREKVIVCYCVRLRGNSNCSDGMTTIRKGKVLCGIVWMGMIIQCPISYVCFYRISSKRDTIYRSTDARRLN